MRGGRFIVLLWFALIVPLGVWRVTTESEWARWLCVSVGLVPVVSYPFRYRAVQRRFANRNAKPS